MDRYKPANPPGVANGCIYRLLDVRNAGRNPRGSTARLSELDDRDSAMGSGKLEMSLRQQNIVCL